MAKSLQQFREWAVKAHSVGNPSGNSYKGQCVSLIQQYVKQVFGQGYKARGNAKDYVPPTFKRVTGALKPGDVVRYGSAYGWGYGHIGMIDDNGNFLDQNGTKPLAVGIRKTPFLYIESVWRPTKKFNVKTPKKKAPTKKTGRIKVKVKTATVLATRLNVRDRPSTKSRTLAVYKRGQTFRYDSYQITGGYVWLSYLTWTGRRRYVAEGPYGPNNKVYYVSGGVG